jgi:hypothetical protein
VARRFRALHFKSVGLSHCRRPIRFRRSLKRGSDRYGSICGSVLTEVRKKSRFSYARSSPEERNARLPRYRTNPEPQLEAAAPEPREFAGFLEFADCRLAPHILDVNINRSIFARTAPLFTQARTSSSPSFGGQYKRTTGSSRTARPERAAGLSRLCRSLSLEV